MSGKVFIQQDDSSTTHCQLQTKESRIDRQQFEKTIRTLSNLYAEAEKLGGQSHLKGCFGFPIFLHMETHYEKVLETASQYESEKIYAFQGLPRQILLREDFELLKSPFMKTEV